MNKIRPYRIALFFGGRSPEHEVSLQSAKNVMQALKSRGHTILPIGIQKNGRWQLYESIDMAFVNPNDPKSIALSTKGEDIALLPFYDRKGLCRLNSGDPVSVDVCFPLIHGSQGEDGTLQGLLEMTGLPYVGATVLGMAVTLDKIVMKKLFAYEGIPTPGFLPFTIADYQHKIIRYDDVKDSLGSPFFVKPSNTGSSIGINKVKDRNQFEHAIAEAFKYDTKILCEEAIDCREIECSVLGNFKPEASLPGEVVPKHEFYSYEAKYLDPKGAELLIPAQIPEEQTQEIQDLAKQAYIACNMSGMARVDFFISRQTDEILLNELNSVPGFTNISMYPKLWEASGLPYADLLERLLELAFERHELQTQVAKHYLTLER